MPAVLLPDPSALSPAKPPILWSVLAITPRFDEHEFTFCGNNALLVGLQAKSQVEVLAECQHWVRSLKLWVLVP